MAIEVPPRPRERRAQLVGSVSQPCRESGAGRVRRRAFRDDRAASGELRQQCPACRIRLREIGGDELTGYRRTSREHAFELGAID